MTSPLQLHPNVTHARVVNHLYVNKTPYVDPNDPNPQNTLARKITPVSRYSEKHRDEEK
jgi:hypothetical protein